MKLNRSVAILLFISLCAASGERVFYKSVMADGRAVYSDAPVTGALRVDKIVLQTTTPQSNGASATASTRLDSRSQTLLKEADARAANQARLETQVEAAYRKVGAARAKLEAGQALGEGDRQGRSLTPQYLRRQDALGKAFADAQQELEAALAESAAVR